MDEYVLALTGVTAIVLFLVNWFLWVPGLQSQVHARLGPWYYFKLPAVRIWLAWRTIKQPRALQIIDPSSKNYENFGLVATELENTWELPHVLDDDESLDGLSFYGTDGTGTFLKISVNRKINRQALVSLHFLLADGTVYQLPNAPDTLVFNTDGRQVFNAAGIKFQLIEAMRSWRIVYNGMVRRISDRKESEVHLRINMKWTALSRPYEFKREFSGKLLAQAIAREPWRLRHRLFTLNETDLNGVDQWGAMIGTYQEDGMNPSQELCLRGLRQRRWGQCSWSSLNRMLTIIGVCEDGNFFYLNAVSDSGRLTHEVSGHLYHPTGTLGTINECDLDLEQLKEEGPFPRDLSIRFSTRRHSYHAIIHKPANTLEEFIGRPWKHQTNIYPCHLTLNSRIGRVLFLATNTFKGQSLLTTTEVSLPYLSSPQRPITLTEASKSILLFSDEACSFERLVGGKGSSLGLLYRAVHSPPVPCRVPAGFCVTVSAWKTQTHANKDLQNIFEQYLQIAKRQVEDNQLQEWCIKASEILKTTPVVPLIQDCIREALMEVFGDEAENKRLAVRSSAVGEDGEEFSAAGQYATILGCRGFKAVLQGLQECWASLLSYQSVQYRRQHGDPLIPGMGVVIQEMVDAEVAGVLFTVNPTDGDPSRMVLTANYGLGESVVSAAVDPDTIYLKRSSGGEITIAERTLGNKQSKIILAYDGKREEPIPEEQSRSICLSDDMALMIGKLGIFLEKSFGGPRDLEFAVHQSVLYLLQARPVTALDAWTDDELVHEFDSPLLTNEDYFTKANVGEVFPGAMTPLNASLIGRIMNLSIQTSVQRDSQDLYEINPWNTGQYFAVFQSQCFVSLIDAVLRDVDAELTDTNRAIDMAIFGHIVTTPEMHRLALQRHGAASLKKKIQRYRSLFVDLFFNHRRVERAKAQFSGYSFPTEAYSDPVTLYHEICVRLPELLEMGQIHMQVSSASATTQTVAFILMLEGREEWTPELYGEMSQLFSSINNIESADVPVALKELATAILNEDAGRSWFAQQPTEVATAWLQSGSGPAGELFRTFLARHGHRSIKELELSTEVWSLNPSALVSVLQSMVSNPATIQPNGNKEAKVNYEHWMKNIRSSNLRALKFFVPRCRNAVAAREMTKSLLVHTLHCFRLAYRRLARLLHEEGKLLDPGLIFFMTQAELRDLVHSESVPSSLVAKAVRRRKLHAEMDQTIFPEISRGIPKPINISKDYESAEAADIELRGTPVFRGTVRATVRVALKLEEVKQIRSGEILITRATDIGWTPYFPLLAGVVTELGGLISHGAVVAREYGLPAIVGCPNATLVFKSGDLAILDTTKGTITRIKPDANHGDP